MLAVIAFHERKAILIDSSVFSSNGFVVGEKVPTGALKVQFFFITMILVLRIFTQWVLAGIRLFYVVVLLFVADGYVLSEFVIVQQ